MKESSRLRGRGITHMCWRRWVRNKRSGLIVSHFSYKVVPHAELWRNELLSVGGSLSGHGRRGRRHLLYGASWNQHPHVESAPVTIYILCWGLSGGCWWVDKEQNKKWKNENLMRPISRRKNEGGVRRDSRSGEVEWKISLFSLFTCILHTRLFCWPFLFFSPFKMFQ